MVILQGVQLFFNLYTLLLVANILLSWFPDFQDNPIARFIRTVTDPYLSLFRKFIPTLGPLDISPIAAFFSLRILEACIVGLFFR